MTDITFHAIRREAEHQMIEWKTRQFLQGGGRIRFVKSTMEPVSGQVRGGRVKALKTAGFHEVEIEEAGIE